MLEIDRVNLVLDPCAWVSGLGLIEDAFHETCNSVTLYFIKKKSGKIKMSDISMKCILPNILELIIFGKMHFLLKPENEFTHEIKRDGRTSFMEFTCQGLSQQIRLLKLYT